MIDTNLHRLLPLHGTGHQKGKGNDGIPSGPRLRESRHHILRELSGDDEHTEIWLAIVIFGRWNPLKATLAAIVFGACDALQLSLQIFGTKAPPQLLLALPYIVTILAISGLFGGEAVQPAALMTPYAKE